MEPISTLVGTAFTSSQMASGMIDRLLRFRDAKLDAKALRRLLLLETRYNLALLDVAVGRKEKLPADALWHVPPLLRVEVMEAVLGEGKEAASVAKELKSLKVADAELLNEGSGVLPNLYARVIALQGLAVLNRQVVLQNIKIAVRLTNLNRDLQEVRKVLAADGR